MKYRVTFRDSVGRSGTADVDVSRPIRDQADVRSVARTIARATGVAEAVVTDYEPVLPPDTRRR